MSAADEKKYSDLISSLRYDGDIEQAIEKCGEATKEFPDNNFFYKVLGDLYAQNHNFEMAFNCYLEQLKHLKGKKTQFKSFARFYKMLEEKTEEQQLKDYRHRIASAMEAGQIPLDITEMLISFLGKEFVVDKEISEIMISTDNDKNLPGVKKSVEQLIKDKKTDEFRAILNYRTDAKNQKKSKMTNAFLISAAERLNLFDDAFKLLETVDGLSGNATLIRTLLRICRKIQDYSFAEERLTMDEVFIQKSDFNIQYELVYYFENNHNIRFLELTLKCMKTSATSSPPIARTLYNFYLRFNMFEEAKQMSEHIKNLNETRKNTSKSLRLEEQYEAEQGVWNKLQELVSEQEHNRQMIAMRDLIRGFSHELGQPITNIRYSVQLYLMKVRRNEYDRGDINELLDLILHQTERIGDMLERFRPIVSSRSTEERFGVYERISMVIDNLKVRMNAQNIQCSLSGNQRITLWGDPIQFDQIFYNLILNSMQAIFMQHREGEGLIKVEVCSIKNNEMRIFFSDNGPGIAEKNAKKIFEPFFTTKDPSTDNGGEGLGLFVVWNILKMFNGKIVLDIGYKKGAKFIMTIKKAEGASRDE